MSNNYKEAQYKIAVVVSNFNQTITKKLLSGVYSFIESVSFSKDLVDVFWVPGAFEIPFLAKKLLLSNKYNGIITLGCVIRGDTPHFDYVCQSVSYGIMKLNLEGKVPVLFGVLTTDSVEQALERSGIKFDNKGYEYYLIYYIFYVR